MEKKLIVIIFICLLLGLGIFLAIWLFQILFPFIEWAQALSDLGITYTGPISYLLEWLFLNPYFIGMIVFGVLTLIVRIIGWKSLKST
jgi:hypothetical protein